MCLCSCARGSYRNRNTQNAATNTRLCFAVGQCDLVRSADNISLPVLVLTIPVSSAIYRSPREGVAWWSVGQLKWQWGMLLSCPGTLLMRCGSNLNCALRIVVLCCLPLAAKINEPIAQVLSSFRHLELIKLMGTDIHNYSIIESNLPYSWLLGLGEYTEQLRRNMTPNTEMRFNGKKDNDIYLNVNETIN